MPKGKAKSKYDFKKETCKYSSQGGYCKLPKFKRCSDCIYILKTGKACMVEI